MSERWTIYVCPEGACDYGELDSAREPGVDVRFCPEFHGPHAPLMRLREVDVVPADSSGEDEAADGQRRAYEAIPEHFKDIR